MVSKWQADRSHINHGWLQNGVLVGLRHAQGISRGAVRSRSPGKAISEDVMRWSERRQEVPQLLDRFEVEMSPRVLFERIPLVRCTEETKRWLIPIIHELWLTRGHFDERIAQAREAYDAVEGAYKDMLNAVQKLPGSPSSSDLNDVDHSLNAFATSCEWLSRCISDLPRDIRCV